MKPPRVLSLEEQRQLGIPSSNDLIISPTPGTHTHKGWYTSDDEIPQRTSITMGKNLRQNMREVVYVTGGRWPGVLVIVTERRDWGVVGYMQMPEADGIARVPVRVPSDMFIKVGEIPDEDPHGNDNEVGKLVLSIGVGLGPRIGIQKGPHFPTF